MVLLAREGELMRAIGAPLVPALYEHARTDDGGAYLVMERLTGPSLAAELADAGELPIERLFGRAGAIAETVATLHARGFVHRDLKPENIFFDGERARLIDLGLARRLVSGSSEDDSIAGTAEYMSPEQCAGATADACADVYAFGVLLFEMATGRVPFFGARSEVQQAHLARRPARPSSLRALPVGFDELVVECLAKQPARRPTMSAVAGALANIDARTTPLRTSAPSAPAELRVIRSLPLLFLRGRGTAAALGSLLSELGARLAHVDGQRWVVAFDDGDEDPIARATHAAERIVKSGSAERAVVDVAKVSVRVNADGSRQLVSKRFMDADAFPLDDGAPVSLSDAALRACAQPPSQTWIGRERELAMLTADARAACAGRPTVAVVVADAGIGKSALAAQLARALGSEAEVLLLRAPELTTAEPAPALNALLRRLFDLPETQPQTRADALIDEPDPSGRAAVRAALGWDPPVGRSDAGARDALIVQLGAVVRRRAQRRPLVLLLDDAHRADPLALAVLENAALDEAGAPLFIGLFARPSFAAHHPLWGRRAAHQRWLTLGPLPVAEAEQLLRALLRPATDVPHDAIKRLCERGAGVPLLLGELARALHLHGAIRRRAESASWYLATDELQTPADLPLLGWLIERELGGLSPSLVAHARLVAALGAEIRLDEVEGVIDELREVGRDGDYPLASEVALARLVDVGVLTVDGGRFGFRHPGLSDALATSLTSERWRGVHAAAVRWYRRRDHDRSASPARVGWHAAQAGLTAEAARLYLEHADDARRRHIYFDAESSYSRALGCLDEDEDRARRLSATAARAVMRYRLGRYEDALVDFTAARELARDLGDRAAEVDLLLDEATARDWVDDPQRSAALVEEAAARVEIPSPLLAANLSMGRGRAAWRLGELATARAHLQAAVAFAEPLGEVGHEPLVTSLVMLGHLLPALGEVEEAHRSLARAIERCRLVGDRVHEAAALNNQFEAWMSDGDVERAVAAQRQSIAIARELGMTRHEQHGRFNLALAHAAAGELARARPELEAALEIEARYPSEAPFAWAVTLFDATLWCLMDRPADAERAVATLRRRGEAPPATFMALQQRMLELALADAAESEWEALDADARGLPEQIDALELRGVSALRHGREMEGRTLLVAAHQLAVEQRSPIRLRLARWLGA